MLQESVLMLNASYEPLNIIHWQKAVRLLYLDKAEIVERFDYYLHSPSTEMPMPAVIRLFFYVSSRHTRLVFSKWNMYIRDDFICQYCSKVCERAELTTDHVIPKSKGGSISWENCVTSCKGCNNKKGNRTPKEARMILRNPPRKPRESRMVFTVKKRKKHGIPDVWTQYLPMLEKSQSK